ncbi:uncharacterized protein DUF2642 [Planifilum fimeticola]|uniref:Uncharacterized protein DUF2642 n=1 Tax=Planifilum fimeticola TaxID=201975 RepID=A0A2T0LHH3_9BACL|nr:DUF2642 domain-containing protein [Planifilum fimeticola]PRX41775.1 uncharacterized protein DUF2642 [Planifilum fimeticola]
MVLNNTLNEVFDFVEEILGIVLNRGVPDDQSIRRLFQSYLGMNVTVETTGGDVTGQVTFVGSDFLELQAGGEIILIPFSSIIFVSPQGGVM